MSVSRDLRALMDRAIRGPYGCRAWISGFAWILNKEGELDRFVPNILQDRILQALEICLANGWPVRILGLKKRQGGLTTICAAILYWLVSVRTTNAMVMGGLKWQSGNVWKYIRFFKDYDKFSWGTGFKLGEEEGILTNGSALQKGTAKQPESCRSAALRALHCTEVARWATDGVANAERILTGAMASLPKLPWTFAIWESTAAGPTGMFYKRWQKAISLEEVLAGRKPRPGQFIKVFAGWHEHDDSRLAMTPDERAEVAASLTQEEVGLMQKYKLDLEHVFFRRVTIEEECNGDPQIFKREFPFTPEEAFSASSKSFFPVVSLAILRKWAEKAENEDKQGGLLHFDKQTKRTVLAFCAKEKEKWWQYEPPMHGRRYHISVDFAEGKAEDEKGDDTDHHCISVWRDGHFDKYGQWRPMREVARSSHPCRWDLDIVEDYIEAAYHLYGRCLVVPENNKDGGVIRNLLKRGINIYQPITGEDERGDTVTAKPSGKYGFKTTGGEGVEGRKAILKDFKATVRQLTDPGLGIELSLRTVEEMEVFIVNKDGKPEAMSGHHDDSVITAAIGYFTRDLGTMYSAGPNDYYTMDPLLRAANQPKQWAGSGGGGFGL